jgi:hypothetical protein
MKNMQRLLILIFIIGLNATVLAQIPVQLPSLSATKGDTVTIPLTLGDLQNKAIYSCYAVITFNHNVLTPISATNVGTISANWAAPIMNLDSLGIIKLGLYGADPLASAGTLVFLKFIASGDFGDTTSLIFRTFEFNANHADDPKPVLQNGFVSIKPKPINITVTTSIGVGTTVTVDGVIYPAPYTTTWEPGTNHTIGVTSPQAAGENTTYYFSMWNDGMAQTHQVSPVTDAVFTANLRTQYLVKITSDYGSPAGAGWYDAGSQVTISVATPVAVDAVTRRVFTGWTGTGTGAYSGTNNPASFTLSAPVVEQAHWKTQYKLEVNTLPAGLVEITGSGWYDAGSTTTTGAAPASVGSGADKKDFFYWLVDNVKVTGNPVSVTMDNAHVATAAYLGYISVKIGTNLADSSVVIVDGKTLTAPVTQTWIKGSEHTLDIPATQLEQNGQRFAFTAWSDGKSRQHGVAPVSDTTFSANLTREFKLNIATEPAGLGNLTGTSWHPAGTTVNLGPAPETVTFQEKSFAFAFWKIAETRFFENAPALQMDTTQSACAYFWRSSFIQGKILVLDEPVPGFTLYLNAAGADSATTDANGEFLFENLAAGEYTLVPKSNGLAFENSLLAINLNAGNIENLILTATDVQAPAIELLTPVGGTKFNQGDPIEINWRAADNMGVDSLVIFFSEDAGANWKLLASPNGSDSSFSWTAPEIISATCLIQVLASDRSGNIAFAQNETPFTIQNPTGVAELAETVFSFKLNQNYPNPFNPTTEISFEMPQAGQVTIKIYNLNGQELGTLFQGWAVAGPHRISWKAQDLPSGVYFYQFRGLGKMITRRMLLTK